MMHSARVSRLASSASKKSEEEEDLLQRSKHKAQLEEKAGKEKIMANDIGISFPVETSS